MPNPQIKVRLSILERRQIAILFPELCSRLELDESNSRMILLSLDEAKRVLEALKSDTRKHRAMIQSALERAMASLANAIEDATGIGSIPANMRLYQFRITLNNSVPQIWRRIQIKNCTLERLHEHIQLAMGWKNEHLHRFRIRDEIYGDAQLLDDGFEDQYEFIDSTGIKIGDVVPKSGKRFTFEYEYDFGDGWVQEVLFEGCRLQPRDRNTRSALRANEPVHPKMLVGSLATMSTLKSSATRTTNNTRKCWSGGASSIQDYSIPRRHPER